jgi:3-oxoacyl-[acyl-carrier protein] reductase
MSAPLDGQVAIVTGGSRGIGAGIARELAKRGAHVALTYVSSPARAQAVVDDIESQGWPKAIAVHADCALPEEVAPKLVSKTVEAFGDKINIIVNNAANGADHLISEITTEIFDVMFHTNVLFPILLVKEALKYLQKHARIVNISSTAARGGESSPVLLALRQ